MVVSLLSAFGGRQGADRSLRMEAECRLTLEVSSSYFYNNTAAPCVPETAAKHAADSGPEERQFCVYKVWSISETA
jgi:hypothetical protein